MATVSALPDDEQLALGSSRGDREAFAALYERHHRGIYDFACRMLRDQDAAADVVQSTFTNAWVNLQKRRVRGNIRAWLYTIARNAAISELRSGRRRVSLDESSSDERLPYAELDRERMPDPERAVLDKEVVELVWDSAAALNPREYSLLDLHLRRGFTPEEMAGSLGLSRGNVHTMLFRLRRSLEESVTGLLLARRGRNSCEELDALLADRDSAILTVEMRRLISRHLETCSRCQENRRRLVSPAEIFAGLALIPMPAASQIAIWKGVAASLAVGGAGIGVVAEVAREGVQWAVHGARSAWAWGAAAGGAVVGGVIVGVLIMSSGGSGGGVEDPADVRSTSHEIGRASAERVIEVEWTPVEADGYSVQWSRGEEDLPDAVRDLPGDASSARSPRLTDGSWYFHMRTEGGGEWTSTVHVGPFVIRGRERPTPTASPEPSPSPEPTGTTSPAAPTPTPTAAPPATAAAPAVTATAAPPPAAVPPTPVTPLATPAPTPAPPTPAPTPIPAVIDIKPGNPENKVNPQGKHILTVALISTIELPADQVNVGSVLFVGAPPRRSAMRDVSGDGVPDLVMQFEIEATTLGPGDREACISGETLAGQQFVGCGPITPLGPGALTAGASGGAVAIALLGFPLAAMSTAVIQRRLRRAQRAA